MKTETMGRVLTEATIVRVVLTDPGSQCALRGEFPSNFNGRLTASLLQ